VADEWGSGAQALRATTKSRCPTLKGKMNNQYKTIISLCDYSGIWSQPYLDAGYKVIRADLASGSDVRLFKFPGKVHGIIAQPPCTHLAGSGARWWAKKGQAALLEALAIVDACLRIVTVSQPEWWVLENPVGRLGDYLGAPAFYFDPCDYGTLGGNEDAYTKKTCLWGKFAPPMPLFVGELTAVAPVLGSKMHILPPSPERARLRSMTPEGFARAFFMVNK